MLRTRDAFLALLQNVVLYAGSAADRATIRDYEFYYPKHQVRAAQQPTKPQCSVPLCSQQAVQYLKSHCLTNGLNTAALQPMQRFTFQHSLQYYCW